MRKLSAILILLAVGLFLMPRVSTALTFNPIFSETYEFVAATDSSVGAYVSVLVEAAEDPTSPFNDGTGTFYLYRYTYQVDNTGSAPGSLTPIDEIGNLQFIGAQSVGVTDLAGTGDVAMTDYTYTGIYQFNFGAGLSYGEISDQFQLLSYYANAELSSMSLPQAVLQDSGQTSYGDLTSDIAAPTGSPLSPVPEPTTLFLLGAGILSVAGLRRCLKTKI